MLWFWKKPHQSIMVLILTRSRCSLRVLLKTAPRAKLSRRTHKLKYTCQPHERVDNKANRNLPPADVCVSKHCFLITTAFMFHLFKWEQPLYKALSHQRNKRQPQAILRGWKICVWLHPSPHQLSPTQRRRWVLGHRPEGDPRRGTWTKMQMPSWVSSSQTNWPSIITNNN